MKYQARYSSHRIFDFMHELLHLMLSMAITFSLHSDVSVLIFAEMLANIHLESAVTL